MSKVVNGQTNIEFREKTTKKEIFGAEFIINEKKKAVTAYVVSKGEKYYGTAKCGPKDEWDVERGKEIALYRVEIAQRRHDLEVTNQVIRDLQGIIDNNNYQVYHRFEKQANISKHWEEFLRLACDEAKSQLNNIHFCEEQIKKLSE